MTMYIDIKEYEDSIFTLECEPKKKIKELKKRIKKERGIAEYCQKLYFKGIELSDDKKFSDYNIIATNDFNVEKRSMIDFKNINQLKTFIFIKGEKIGFLYYFKASDSIESIKKKIFETENIPIEKMEILYSNKVINDETLIEDFDFFNLTFTLNLLEGKENISIKINDGNNIETYIVNPFLSVYEIQSQLNKNFDFRLSFNGEILNIRKLLIQYKIKDGDILQLIKSKGIIDVFLDYKINKMFAKIDLEETILEFLKYISVFFNVKYSLIECVIKGKDKF